MKNFALIFTLLFSWPVTIFCQHVNEISKSICDNDDVSNELSKIDKEYNKSFNPFKKASEVALVSYAKNGDEKLDKKYWDNQVKMTETGEFVMMEFTEYQKLNKNGVDSLSKVIYGKSCKQKLLGSECYFPRHAIVFKDEAGNIFACIEICFACSTIKVLPEDVQPFVICENKLDAINLFFKRYGLKNGFKKML